MQLEQMKNEIINHLKDKIIPFWSRLKDENNGGFYGRVDFELNIDKGAHKGAILNSRILWFFSASYLTLKDKTILIYAEHAYEFLKKYLIDNKYGGIFWIVDCKGHVVDDRKNIYNQAFAIYALSEFYKATKNSEALDIAVDLYNLIEKKCRDEIGYYEDFDRVWNVKKQNILCEYDKESIKTMNAHLHILEAYTNLYTVWKNNKLKEDIKELLVLFRDKIFNHDLLYLHGFFDKNFNPTIDFKSYGHDIEASWLLDRACETIGNDNIPIEIKDITTKIADKIIMFAFINNSVINETVNGKTDFSRVWWVQAEALVGFFNAYTKTNDPKFLKASKNIWDYIKKYIIDSRNSGEWFWKVDGKNIPYKLNIVEPWKCPYHNGRMCIEIIERMEKYV